LAHCFAHMMFLRGMSVVSPRYLRGFSAVSPQGIDAIIFGAIGTVAHCSEPQWKGFNQALGEKVAAGELKLPLLGKDEENRKVYWDKTTYRASLTATGGRNRLQDYLLKQAEDNAAKAKITDELIASIYARKNAFFLDYIMNKDGTQGLVLRPGIKGLMKEAKAAGVKTAFCTLGVKDIVDAFVETLGLTDQFDIVTSVDDLHKFNNNPKPAPDCYHFVAEALFPNEGIDEILKNREIVAFEDSSISMQSPVSAGMPTVIATPNNWTTEHDYSDAHKCVGEVAELGGLKMLDELAVEA